MTKIKKTRSGMAHLKNINTGKRPSHGGFVLALQPAAAGSNPEHTISTML